MLLYLFRNSFSSIIMIWPNFTYSVLLIETPELGHAIKDQDFYNPFVSHWDHRKLHRSFQDLKIFFNLPKLFTYVGFRFEEKKLTMKTIQNFGYQGINS